MIAGSPLISIHSLRAERDVLVGYNPDSIDFISIHSLRAERDRLTSRSRASCVNFNPLAPCGARPCSGRNSPCDSNFNPLAPCGARQILNERTGEIVTISIHSLRAERDTNSLRQNHHPRDFNPLAPCGARPWTYAAGNYREIFQSTRSVRSETRLYVEPSAAKHIPFQSTRSVRSETVIRMYYFHEDAFQSTRSVRSETRVPRPCCARIAFQSTRSVRSETRDVQPIKRKKRGFQSTRSVRSETS